MQLAVGRSRGAPAARHAHVGLASWLRRAALRLGAGRGAGGFAVMRPVLSSSAWVHAWVFHPAARNSWGGGGAPSGRVGARLRQPYRTASCTPLLPQMQPVVRHKVGPAVSARRQRLQRRRCSLQARRLEGAASVQDERELDGAGPGPSSVRAAAAAPQRAVPATPVSCQRNLCTHQHQHGP